MVKEASIPLEKALELTSEARVITTASKPFKIIHTNKAFSELTGYKFHEVVGKTCSFLQGEDTETASLDVLHAGIKASQKVTVQVVNYKKDGTPFVNHLTVAPVGAKDASATYMTGTLKHGKDAADAMSDTAETAAPQSVSDKSDGETTPKAAADTDDKAVKPARSKRSLEPLRLNDVFENTNDAIVITSKDPPFKIIHTNQAWCDMCGYHAEEVEGLTNAILGGPETDQDCLDELMACVRRCEPTVQTLVNYKKGGVRFVNQVKVSPVYDEKDDLSAFMAMLHEIE